MSETNLPPLPCYSPYLVQALYTWLVEANHTPMIMVDALVPGVDVPIDHVKEGRIVLNVSMSATDALQFAPTALMFRARFNGHSFNITVPYSAIIAVFSRQSGLGMLVPHLTRDHQMPASGTIEAAAVANIHSPVPSTDNVVKIGDGAKRNRDHLKIVK